MINLNGTDYVVIASLTINYKGSERTQLTLRRPRGKVTYRVVKYANGTYSSIV